MKKYIFVTGGVCSSLGKGVAASSIGTLLEARNFVVRMVKIDPYINVDAGTMSPYQHGEVYVTDDGAETDLDLGNYARFTKSTLSRANSITTGQLYQEVIRRERAGNYLGRTVQVVPHITDRIKQRIRAIGEEENVDLTIVEVGGTVGDIESIPFLEAARQMIQEHGRENVVSVHLTLIPELAGGEHKTKPTQHAVNKMREIGIQPDVLLCRTATPIDDDIRRKVAQFTNVRFESVISAHDAENIYEVPLIYQSQSLDSIILDCMNIENRKSDMSSWKKVVHIIKSAEKKVTIGMIGKYIGLADAYKSVDEALQHAGISNTVAVTLRKIDSENLEAMEDPGETGETLRELDGILIPGGFGVRGVGGMVIAAKYAREHNMPYFGICLGMHVMIIEYARSLLGYENANSTEFRPEAEHPVISLLEEQENVKDYGGTMRLGLSESRLVEGTRLQQIYGSASIRERHRHRYEVSNRYRQELTDAGIVFSAFTPGNELVEASEWPGHPWGIGVQFHPEFRSSPLASHPLFVGFVAASMQAGAKKA